MTMQVTNIEMKQAQDAGRPQEEIDQLRWDEEKLQFLTALFEVDDKSVCY